MCSPPIHPALQASSSSFEEKHSRAPWNPSGDSMVEFHKLGFVLYCAAAAVVFLRMPLVVSSPRHCRRIGLKYDCHLALPWRGLAYQPHPCYRDAQTRINCSWSNGLLSSQITRTQVMCVKEVFRLFEKTTLRGQRQMAQDTMCE